MEYRDQDLAASALRNLNRAEVMRRELKVDYASDGKNGVNLREGGVRERDAGEVVNERGECMGGGRHEGGREEVMRAMSLAQEERLLNGIKEIYQRYVQEGDV